MSTKGQFFHPEKSLHYTFPFSFRISGIIKCITVTTLYMNSMWWPPNTLGGFLNQNLFLILSALASINYVMALVLGPSFLPFKWKPEVGACLPKFHLELVFLIFSHPFSIFKKSLSDNFTTSWSIPLIICRKFFTNNFISNFEPLLRE